MLYLSLIWVWKLLNEDYCDIPQGPMTLSLLTDAVYVLPMQVALGQWEIQTLWYGNHNTEVNYHIEAETKNGRHFPDNIFECIFFNENMWISINISLKFVPKGPVNNIPSLVQIMACCLVSDKPSSEAMVVSLLRYMSLGFNELRDHANNGVSKICGWIFINSFCQINNALRDMWVHS